jgi:hypothetical protein
MNVFAQAQAGLSLTPGQRAFLKAVEGFAFAAITAAAVALFQLTSTGTINVARDWPFVAGAGAVAFLSAASKYYKAQGDAPLSSALGQAAAGVQKWAGANDVGNKPAPVVMPGPSMPVSTVVTWTPAAPPESTTAAPTT